jgi:probable rRNA maturation factor
MPEPPQPPPSQPPSPGGDGDQATVVATDEQRSIDVDVDRWRSLATRVLQAEGRRGELTLTFVEPDEIAELNAEHLGKSGPTDVLSFPLDSEDDAVAANGSPMLLGDVVICPAVAQEQASAHAGSLDDELALLVVHGVLHVLGHDHAEPDETATMRSAELAHLEALHWRGPAPAGFRQDHDE